MRARVAFEAAAVSVAGRQVEATVSVGAACRMLNPEVASLLITADAALYRAKANGRNRVEVAAIEMPTIFTTARSPAEDRRDAGGAPWVANVRPPASEPALAA